MTRPRPGRARRWRRYLLVTRGGPEGPAAARWLRTADPAAAVTILCLLPPPAMAWWCADGLDYWPADAAFAHQVDRALDAARAALDLPGPRVRAVHRAGGLTREIRAELRRDDYTAVVVGVAPGRLAPRVGRLDVPLVLVPHTHAGQVVALHR